MSRAPIRIGDRLRFQREVAWSGRTWPAGTEATVVGLGLDARYGFVLAETDAGSALDPLPTRIVVTVPPAHDPAAVAADDPTRMT